MKMTAKKMNLNNNQTNTIRKFSGKIARYSTLLLILCLIPYSSSLAQFRQNSKPITIFRRESDSGRRCFDDFNHRGY